MKYTLITLLVKAGNWMDISGLIGKSNTPAGITDICHPKNPSLVNQWILSKSNSMQNVVFPYPGKELIPLSQKKNIYLKYTLLLHQDNISDIDIPLYKN